MRHIKTCWSLYKARKTMIEILENLGYEFIHSDIVGFGSHKLFEDAMYTISDKKIVNIVDMPTLAKNLLHITDKNNEITILMLHQPHKIPWSVKEMRAFVKQLKPNTQDDDEDDAFSYNITTNKVALIFHQYKVDYYTINIEYKNYNNYMYNHIIHSDKDGMDTTLYLFNTEQLMINPFTLHDSPQYELSFIDGNTVRFGAENVPFDDIPVVYTSDIVVKFMSMMKSPPSQYQHKRVLHIKRESKSNWCEHTVRSVYEKPTKEDLKIKKTNIY